MITNITVKFTEVTSRFERPGASIRNLNGFTAKVERQATEDGPFNIEMEIPLNESEQKEFKGLCDKIEARVKTEVTA